MPEGREASFTATSFQNVPPSWSSRKPQPPVCYPPQSLAATSLHLVGPPWLHTHAVLFRLNPLHPTAVTQVTVSAEGAQLASTFWLL